MSTVVTLLIASATLAFGSVYPWGYWPLFGIAACIGVAGLTRHRGIPAGGGAISIGWLLVAAAVALQLIPLPRTILNALSPHTAVVLSNYSLMFARTTGPHSLSVNPDATAVGLAEVICLGLYVTGLGGLLSKQDLLTLPRNLAVFAALLALVGLYGREHNNGLVFGFWQPYDGSNSNGFGPFINRNHFAGWMLMATCLTIGTLCGRIEAARPGQRRWITWLSTSAANRIVQTGLGITVMAISLVWTLSRSGILSFGCALAVFAWLVIVRRNLGRGMTRVTVGILGGVLLMSVSWRGIDSLQRWFADTADLQSRLAAWHDGWSVVRDFAAAGTGINTYPDAMIFYQRHVLALRITHAHNDYLQLLAEGGLLVCIPVAISVALLIVTVRRRWREATESYDHWVRVGAGVGLIGIGIQEIAEFSLHIPANALLFATLAVIATAPVSRARLERPATPSTHR